MMNLRLGGTLVETRNRFTVVWPIVLLLVLGFGLFSSTGHDDSYITLWPAYALEHFGRIINYNGDRVEQSSSLAEVLILAALSKVTHVTLGSLAVLLSVGFGCLTVWLTQVLARRFGEASWIGAGWLAGSTASLIYWSFGGLETTLAASAYAIVVIVSAGVLRSGLTFSSALASLAAILLATITRPEAMFVLGAVFGAMTIGVLAASRSSRRNETAVDNPAMLRMLWLVAAAGIAAAAVLLWRHWYFGAWVPQPVLVKNRGLSKSAIGDGFRYMQLDAWERIDGAVWLLALPASLHITVEAFRRRLPDPSLAIAALFTAVGVGFVITSGGDWMEGSRFLVPILPMALVCVLTALGAWIPRQKRAAIIVLVVLQLSAAIVLARTESYGGPPWATDHVKRSESGGASWFDTIERLHYRDLPASARLAEVIARVHARTGHRVTVMSGQMGFMPYQVSLLEFGDVRFLDTWGLVTRDFSQCPATSYVWHTSRGLLLPYPAVFAERDRMLRLCGIGTPDLIYDVDGVDWHTARFVEANGYTVVYKQDGNIVNGSRWFPGAPVNADEFIAVRRDLDEGLKYPTVHFGQ